MSYTVLKSELTKMINHKEVELSIQEKIETLNTKEADHYYILHVGFMTNLYKEVAIRATREEIVDELLDYYNEFKSPMLKFAVEKRSEDELYEEVVLEGDSAIFSTLEYYEQVDDSLKLVGGVQ